jgi:predicted transcriptional regulator
MVQNTTYSIKVRFIYEGKYTIYRKMAQKIKTRYVEVNVKKSNFVSKLIGEKKKDHDFSDIKLLRKILSNEKSRILYALKYEKPSSIYGLAKLLKRDFKSVREDVKLLERFGFIVFYAEKKGKRESLRPVLAIDKLQIIIDI